MPKAAVILQRCHAITEFSSSLAALPPGRAEKRPIVAVHAAALFSS